MRGSTVKLMINALASTQNYQVLPANHIEAKTAIRRKGLGWARKSKKGKDVLLGQKAVSQKTMERSLRKAYEFLNAKERARFNKLVREGYLYKALVFIGMVKQEGIG